MWGAAALSLTSDVPLATGNGGPRGLCHRKPEMADTHVWQVFLIDAGVKCPQVSRISVKIDVFFFFFRQIVSKFSLVDVRARYLVRSQATSIRYHLLLANFSSFSALPELIFERKCFNKFAFCPKSSTFAERRLGAGYSACEV